MQQGLHYHQNNDFANAQTCYEKSLQCQSSNYETLQLLGALNHKLGNFHEALDYLHRSLALNGQQAHVINTAGNVHKALGEHEEAARHYRNAMQLKADYLDPYINLSQMLILQADWRAAEQVLDLAEQKLHKHWQILRIKALLLREKGNFEASTLILQEANRLRPKTASVLHDLGLSNRLAGFPNQALIYYRELETLGYQSEVFFHNYANALNDLSSNEQALEYYSRALALNPLARETLLNWCDLMWESGYGKDMFAAYAKAIEHKNATIEIYYDYLKKLLRTDVLSLARDVFEQMQQHYLEHNLTKLSKLALQRAQKYFSIDVTQLVGVFEDKQLILDDKLEAIEYILECAEYEFALEQLQKLKKSKPDDQWLLALLHTCSRLLPNKPAIFPPLEDYVFEYALNPPSGLTMDEFIEQLSVYLLSLHSSKEQPLEQTLHKGTQTRGNLFNIEHPLLTHIQSEYRKAVKQYQQQLSHLPELYPGFWQNADTEFSGSWSVALKQNGYHNHHIHPMGWLSSACYIVLPHICEQNNQGYFQVGIPNLANNGLKLSPLREVKPELGKLVLFPSMLWHGTVPFDENALRLSIACDIVYRDKDTNN